MEQSLKPRRVKLKKDLTKYDEKLVEGSMGYTIPMVKLSVWGSLDSFCAVKFDNGVKLDIGISSLLFVDEN